MNYERARDDGLIIVYLGPDTRGIAFVASKFNVVSFLTALDAVLKKSFSI